MTPFDALEFDEALATIDTGYDLAFLLMDLDHRVGRPAANRVLNRYVARTGDAGLVAALPLWLSLRAMIRAHAVAKAQGAAQGLPYLDLAEAMLAPPPPRLVAVGGLQGTGKSRLARALAPVARRRARRAGAAQRRDPQAPGRAGAGGSGCPPRPTRRRRAPRSSPSSPRWPPRRCAAAMPSSPMPPSCGRRSARRSRRRAATPPFQGFWLEAPLEVLRARVAARRGDASDADAAVLEAAAARDPGPIAWQRLDAAGATRFRRRVAPWA